MCIQIIKKCLLCSIAEIRLFVYRYFFGILSNLRCEMSNQRTQWSHGTELRSRNINLEGE